MKQLYREWQEEELSARVAAILAGADLVGADDEWDSSKPPRGAMFGVALHRLKKALDSLEAQFLPDWETLKARQERIDKYRLPYLKLLETLKEEIKAQLSPEPKSKAASQKK
jgi:hypothetical protein